MGYAGSIPPFRKKNPKSLFLKGIKNLSEKIKGKEVEMLLYACFFLHDLLK